MYLYNFFIRITLNKMTINEDYLINYSSGINKILSQSKIIPILVIDDLDDGLNICEALLKGGINVIEITLRTPNAFKISEQIIRKIPEINVGIGTVINKAQIIEAFSIGSHFAVSPGYNEEIIDLCLDELNNFPYLPGISCPSEIINCLNKNVQTMKCFPISSMGGVDFIKQMYSVFSKAKFCPTGGIDGDSYSSYIKLPNVLTVGGSFIVNKEIIKNKEWNSITENAKFFLKKAND